MSQQGTKVAWLVGLGFIVMFLSCAIKGVYQVWFVSIAAHFGRSRGDFAISAALFMLAGGLSAPLVGALADRIGPMRTVSCGCVLAGIAMLLAAALPDHFIAFVLAYGVLAAVALTAMTYVPMGLLVDQLFDSGKKGLAYALVTNGTAIGFIVLSPLWFCLQSHLNWQQMFSMVGFLFVLPLALLTHWAARHSPAVLAPPLQENATSYSGWRAAWCDPGFYILSLGFMSCGATMAFVDVHLVPLWQDQGIARADMGMSLSLLGILELCSSVGAAWLAVRVPKHRVLASFYLARVLAMLLLLSHSHFMSTYLFAAVFGASYMGTVVLTSTYCLDRYGAKAKGQIFGVLFMLHQLGAFLSAHFDARGFDVFGSYRPAVTVLAIFAMGASILSLLLGTRRSINVALAPE